MTSDALTAEQILAIPVAEPGRLFTGDPATARAEYRRLAAIWHPDRNGDARANSVFQHIANLYEVAELHLANGKWMLPGVLRLRARDGKVYELRYRKRRSFELGELFIGNSVVAYVLSNEYADLCRHAVDTINGFSFATPTMQAEVARYLPSIAGSFETPDSAVLVIKKSANHVLLRDLLDHLEGKLAPVHVAWILSSLLNAACYLEYAGLTHNAISPDTYFVSPADHNGALLGGWWYAAVSGTTLKAAPARALRLMPPDMLSSKQADARLDLELIRSVGRELLGDESGVTLVRDSSVPKPLAQWLRLASKGEAVLDYEYWQRHVLTASFGKRRFVRLNLSPDDIYN